jgi:hypothetical protein
MGEMRIYWTFFIGEPQSLLKYRPSKKDNINMEPGETCESTDWVEIWKERGSNCGLL